MEVSATLRELEASLLSNAVRKHRVRVAELLAEEFREFGRSGTIYDKAKILEFLQDEEDIRVTMSDFACRQVVEGVALVTYRSERTEPDGTKIDALRSSLWTFRDQRWQMVFHHGTPLGLAGTGLGMSAATREKV